MGKDDKPAGYVVYRGKGFGAVSFNALPGLQFKPGKAVGLTAQQLRIAKGIAALSECDEAGKVVDEQWATGNRQQGTDKGQQTDGNGGEAMAVRPGGEALAEKPK